MSKKKFLKNTLILTVTALMLRAMGMFFRVYMSNQIGAAGMGLYQMIFSVYMLAATFSTSGISTAVMRLTADELVCGNKKTVVRILRRAITITVAASLLITAVLFCFADTIANLFIGDARSVRSLQILSFSLLFMGVSACIKGYFMARRKVATPSFVQMFEQVVRMSVTFYLLSQYAARGIEFCCFAVFLADTVAETLSCLAAYLCYRIDRKRLSGLGQFSQTRQITKKIFKIASPIIAGHYLSSFLHTVESLLMPKCLAGFSGSKEDAIAEFGMLKGMAMPIIFFPSSFLQSFSSLLIPEISEANALKNDQKIKSSIKNAISFTLTSSMLIAVIFMLCADDLAMLLYHNQTVGTLIRALAPLIPLMYLESVVDGILKGLDQQSKTLLYSAIDSVLRIALILIFVPRFGMEGFLMMMVVSNAFTSLLNLHRLLKVTHVKFNFKEWALFPGVVSILTVLLTGTLLHVFQFSGFTQIAFSAFFPTMIFLCIFFHQFKKRVSIKK